MSSSNGSISASRSSSGGYSAPVRLFLRFGGEQIPLAQVGGGRLYFDSPVRLPAGRAELVVEIEGEPRSTSIVLPECSGAARVVTYSVL